MKTTEFIYSLAISVYELLIQIASIFNDKARKWVEGRKKQQEILNSIQLKHSIWFHVSSLGEFEQGRVLLEHLKKNHPEIPIVLTFFSPSGYEIRKNYPHADYIFYLPVDHNHTSLNFIEKIQPRLAFFVKYDYWYFYFKHLHDKNIPVFVISAVFNHKHFLFRPWALLLRRIPSYVTHFFVQDENSCQFLTQKGYSNVTIAGDTRIDRVIEISADSFNFSDEKIEKFKGNRKLLIAGSSYQAEEKFILQSIHKNLPGLKYIIVPHEVSEKRLNEIRKIFKNNCLFYSKDYSDDELIEKSVLVVDRIGILNRLYKYGDIALIGGGFNKGIHNLLEPASHKIPVIFGPKNHHKFPETAWLINSSSGFLIKNYPDFLQILGFLLKDNQSRIAGERAFEELNKRKGGTCIIYQHLTEHYPAILKKD